MLQIPVSLRQSHDDLQAQGMMFLVSTSYNTGMLRPVHPPYSSVFSTEFNPEYGNTDLLFWLRKRSSPKYGNAHGYLNIFLR